MKTLASIVIVLVLVSSKAFATAPVPCKDELDFLFRGLKIADHTADHATKQDDTKKHYEYTRTRTGLSDAQTKELKKKWSQARSNFGIQEDQVKNLVELPDGGDVIDLAGNGTILERSASVDVKKDKTTVTVSGFALVDKGANKHFGHTYYQLVPMDLIQVKFKRDSGSGKCELEGFGPSVTGKKSGKFKMISKNICQAILNESERNGSTDNTVEKVVRNSTGWTGQNDSRLNEWVRFVKDNCSKRRVMARLLDGARSASTHDQGNARGHSNGAHSDGAHKATHANEN